MPDSQDAAPPLSANGPSSEGQTLLTQHGSAPLSLPLDPADRLAAVETAGQTIAGYVVEGELGRGGMGVVYRARQPGLNRVVALKMILHADHAGTEERLRFLREAEALARLRHENIVQIYEVGEHDGKPFISLEYVEGGSLDQHLKGTPLPPLEAARLVRQLADAVQAAHEAGIIHRDLKPANVLLASRGRESPTEEETGDCRPRLATPKITDFGLAKKQDEGGLSVSGAIMGTPSYMAPEQAAGKGKETDARTDVYSLGAILYECLTGRPPFRAATALDTLLQVITEEPVAVRSLQPATPMDIETICLKCLQKDPARRYGTARELAEDLKRFVAGEPVQARPVGRLERGWRWARRNPTTASLLTGIALLLVTVAVVSSVLGRLAWQNAQEEAAARNKADAEEKNAKRLLYASQLALVQSFWAEGNVQEARNTLEELKEYRDTWEHRYLNNLLNYRGQRTFLGHANAVKSVSFSPDGKRIASGSGPPGNFMPGEVKVWDAASGQELLTLKGHTSGIGSVSFSPDGNRIALGSRDGTVKIWDAASGQELLTLKGHTSWASRVTFSPDGKRIASGSMDKTVKVWDTVTGQDLLTLKGHTETVWSVSFSPDGTRIISGSRDGTVKVWDAASGQELLTLKGHTADVESVSFSPDGNRIASGSRDSTVKVWDAPSGHDLLGLKGDWGVVSSVSFSPDGKRIASGNQPDAKHIASGNLDKTVKVWDAVGGQDLLTLKGHTKGVTSVSFSRDSKRIVSGSYDETVKVWDAVSGQDLLTLKGHQSAVSCVSFSPDGKRLASGSWDQTVKVWDAASGQELLTLKGHPTQVSSVSFSPEGQRIASGSWDQTVKVWDAVTGHVLLTLKGHTKEVLGVSFSLDGRRIVSHDSGGTQITWDLATGQPIAESADKTVTAYAPRSPDGRSVAVAEGSVIRVHRLPDGTQEAAAEWRWWVDPNPRWHELQARESWQAGDWFAADFHLGRLQLERPWDARLYVQRARALGQREHHREAAIQTLQAILLDPRVRWNLPPSKPPLLMPRVKDDE